MKNKCIVLLTLIHPLFAAVPSWTPEECNRIAVALCSNEYFPPKHLIEGSKRQSAIALPDGFDHRRGNAKKEVLDRRSALTHLMKVKPVDFDISCFCKTTCNITTFVAYLIYIVRDKDLVSTVLASRDPREMPFAFFKAVHVIDGPEHSLKTMDSFLSWHNQAKQPYACLFGYGKLALAYKTMGYCALQLGRPQDALSYYNQSLNLKKTGEVLSNISSCWTLLGDDVKSASYLAQAKQLGFDIEKEKEDKSAIRTVDLAAYQDTHDNGGLTLDKVRGAYNLAKDNLQVSKKLLFNMGCMYVERASDPREIQGVLKELISYSNIIEIDVDAARWFNQKVLEKRLQLPEIERLTQMFYARVKSLQESNNYLEALNICANLSHSRHAKGLMEEILHQTGRANGMPAVAITFEGESGAIQLSGGELANFNPKDANRGLLRRLRNIGVSLESELYKNALSQVEVTESAKRDAAFVDQQDEIRSEPQNFGQTVGNARGKSHRSGPRSCAVAASCDLDDNVSAQTFSSLFNSRLALIEAERLSATSRYALPESRVFELSVSGASGGGSGTLQILYEIVNGNRLELARFRPHTHYNFDEAKSKAILWQYYLLQEAFKTK